MRKNRPGRQGNAPYLWMATGAVTLGVGAGLACGVGVAQADAGTTGTGAVSPRPHVAASAAPAQRHGRDLREQLSQRASKKPNSVARRALSTGVAGPTARAGGSSLAVPALPSLPSPGVVIQQAINVLTTVVNNTPIRSLLDAVDPVTSSSGVSAVRLPGIPVGTAMSADGTRAFVTTAPFTGGWFYPLLPTAYSVTEIDTKTNTIVGVPVAVEGGASGAVMLSPDGARAFLTTNTGAFGDATRVTAIDTANSGVVRTVDLTGRNGGTHITPDGSRVFVETLDSSSVTITMLDGGTGAAMGAPLQLSGFPIGNLAFSGARGYQTTISSSASSSMTTVTAIDTTNNSIAGSTTFDGVADGGVVISPDGTKAAQATHDPYVGTASTLTLFDPRTGAVTGTPVSLDGWRDPYVPALFSRGSDRLSVITNFNGVQSRLVVIDTSAGTFIAAPITLAGYPVSSKEAEVFGPEANLLYIAMDPNDGTAHTAAVVVDTANGTIVGSPLILDGNMVGTDSFSISSDRIRVFQTLVHDNGSAVSIIGTDGSLIEPTITISGYATRPVVFNADGSRAYQSTRGINSLVTAIDANTGSVIGNPVGVKGDWGDDILVGDGGNYIYDTTHITLLELVIPLPGPWGFGIVFSLGSTHVNAIDTAAF